MNTLLLSISLKGGAGGAAYRLHQGLQGIGVDSQILVKTKHFDDEAVLLTPNPKLVRLASGLGRLMGNGNMDQLPLKLYRHREQAYFHLQWLPDTIAAKAEQLGPDLINLHWTYGGWMRIETLSKLKKPLVWTLHDMWPFTGGCVYSQDCNRYIERCGACPQLRSYKGRDLSRWVWRRKAKAWRDLDLTAVAPSSWLADCARSSSLFKNVRVEVIPHGIDTGKYKPLAKNAARRAFDLPQDKQLVLFGAWSNDPRKGFNLLISALKRLAKCGWKDKIELVVFGFRQPGNPLNLGIRTHFIGKLRDETSMVLIYSAADVLVTPSTEETFGLVIVESLSCGTPVVAFDATGPKDLVEHMRNGFLAKPFDVGDLSRGIAWVLEDKDRHQRLSHRARKKVEQEFTLEQYAHRYQELFTEIVENHNALAHGQRQIQAVF